MNGTKSRGAVTERGKAIASRNATKHGLLAKQPPLLASEDLETFQGLVQGLIDQYDPQTPIEHLLIQQVAMGWQRLHRLWGVEVAIANLEMAKAEKEAKYPRQSIFKGLFRRDDEERFDPQTLKREQVVVQELISEVEMLTYELPKRKSQLDWSADAWKKTMVKSIKQAIKRYPRAAIPAELDADKDSHEILFSTFLGELYRNLTWFQMEWLSKPKDLKRYADTLFQACQSRVSELNTMLEDMQRLDQEVKLALAASKAIPSDLDKLSRYERHIWQGLTEAIERLEKMQHHRNNQGSMGSFRQDG